MQQLQNFFQNPTIFGGVMLVLGALATALFGAARARMRVIEYSVNHQRIGIAAEDVIFGQIQILWQGNQVPNLYTSRVEMVNTTGRDFTNFRLKVYTGETRLFNERSEITGTPNVLVHSEEYMARIRVQPGQTPSENQIFQYQHTREYLVPVFNRGQRIAVTYLTVHTGGNGPAVWLDLQHTGVKLRYRSPRPAVMGVDLRIAIGTGLVVSAGVAVACALWISQPWLIAAICLTVGLTVAILGAALVRIAQTIWSLLAR